MKGQERDERLVAAAETSARAAAWQVRDAQAEKRRVRHAELAAVHPGFRRLFGGEKGAVALLRGIPGFAGLWRNEVPVRAVREASDRAGLKWSVISCSCGEQLALRPGMLGDCSCGKWFLSTGVRVRVFTPALEQAA